MGLLWGNPQLKMGLVVAAHVLPVIMVLMLVLH